MRYLQFGLLGVLAVGALVGGAHPAHAATFTVDSTADAVDASPGDGACATAGGACALRAAIQETNALPGPDTVSLPAGVYTLSIPGPGEDAAATGDLDVTDDLTISGAGADATVIDGGDLDRVLQTAGSLQVDISNVAIVNGSTASFFPDDGFGSGLGGGILNDTGVTLTLTGATVRGNWASHGGGGINNAWPAGVLTLINSAVTGNTGGVSGEGGGGGGISNGGTATLIGSVVSGNTSGLSGGGVENGGTLRINNSTISDNTVGLFTGGGISNGGTATLIGSTISGNTAEERGGGIFNLGSIAVTNSSISNNEASLFDGGGIANDARSVTLTGVTISGNKAGANGGGIANGSGDASPVLASTLTATNVTISGNSAGASGGGIYSGGGINVAAASLMNVTASGNGASANGASIFNNAGATVALRNTIVANSAAGDHCAGPITSAGHNLEDADTCGFTAPGDLIDSNPLLGALADNGGDTATHALLAGSPAVDAGDGSECPETDQRGVPRPIDGNSDGVAVCDIGAYEASEGTSTSPTPTPTPTPVASATPTPAALPRSGGAPPAVGGGSDMPAAAVAGALAMTAAGVMVVMRIRIRGDRRGGEQRE